MNEWAWECERVLSGTGRLVNSKKIFSPDRIENLRFTIKGKLGSDVELSRLVKRIMEEDLETGKSKKLFLPASVFEVVLRALWRIKIRNLKTARINDRHLIKDNYFFELCECINEGEKVNQLYAIMFHNQQNVDIRLKFRNRNISGSIVFSEPVKESVAKRFTRILDDLVPMFYKKKIKIRREQKISLFARILIPTRYRYGFYQLPSGNHLGVGGNFDGRGK